MITIIKIITIITIMRIILNLRERTILASLPSMSTSSLSGFPFTFDYSFIFTFFLSIPAYLHKMCTHCLLFPHDCHPSDLPRKGKHEFHFHESKKSLESYRI